MEVAALRVNTYPGLMRELDRRRQELGLRMEDVDAKSGVADRYSAKLFAGVRRFGGMSLPAILGALQCDLVVVPRSATAASVEPRGLSASKADRFEHRALPSPNEGSSL
jgi:hypothetical protein